MWGVGFGDSVAHLEDAPVLGVQDGQVKRMAVKGENGEGGLVGVGGGQGSKAPRHLEDAAVPRPRVPVLHRQAPDPNLPFGGWN